MTGFPFRCGWRFVTAWYLGYPARLLPAVLRRKLWLWGLRDV